MTYRGGGQSGPGGAGASVPALFALTTLIWGSTWLAITFQLGVVAPVISVAYRFGAAAILLALWCRVTGRSLALGRRDHFFLALQGTLLFGIDYVAIYEAERHLTSGLVAVLFSTIVFMNPIGMRLCYGERIAHRTIVAAVLGCAGVALLFLPELASLGWGGSSGGSGTGGSSASSGSGGSSASSGSGGDVAIGIAYALGGTVIAAIGNMLAVRNHRAGIGVMPATTWAMGWGALAAALIAIGGGTPWTLDPRPEYWLALGYLAVFGSIVAFLAYFTLIGKVGVAVAGYTGVATPVIAVLLSTLFEGFAWTLPALAGVLLAAAGNVIALRRPR